MVISNLPVQPIPQTPCLAGQVLKHYHQTHAMYSCATLRNMQQYSPVDTYALPLPTVPLQGNIRKARYTIIKLRPCKA